jgi:phospholipase D1/2
LIRIVLTSFTGLPYFKFLKKEGREKGTGDVHRTDFAKLQREALENYLIGVIKAVVRFLFSTSSHLALLTFVNRCSAQMQTDSLDFLRCRHCQLLWLSVVVSKVRRWNMKTTLYCDQYLFNYLGKAGYLRVLSSNMSRKGAHTGLLAWKRNHEPKWWLVRESYLVAVEDPGEVCRHAFTIML